MVDPLNQLPKPKGENGSDFGSAIYLSCQTARSMASITSWILMKASRMFSVSPRLCFSAKASAMSRRCVTSLSCCDQLLNILVILSHSGGLLLINLFARRPWQLGDIGRDPLLFKYFHHVRRRTPQFLKQGQRMPSICMLRSSVPGGNIGKPLMLALGALLASDPKRTLVSGIGPLV